MTSSLIRALLLMLLVWPPHPVVAGGMDSRVVHVVLVWLKEPGNATHRARVVEATRSFSTIPGVEEIRVGEPVPSGRPTVDDSFDIGLYMIFASKEALDAYLVHPEHQAAQREILRPLVRRVIVYDFWNE